VLWTHHEPVTSRRIFGVAIGFGGVIAVAGASALFGLGQSVAGQTAIILATISSAFSVIQGRRFDSIAPELVSAGMLTSAAIVLVPFSFIVEAPWQVSPSAPSIIALLVNAIIATALGFAIYFRLIRTVGSMATASVGYLKPAVGVLLGCLIFGEPFTVAMALGLFAILLGVAIISGGIPPPGVPLDKSKAGYEAIPPLTSVSRVSGPAV
jgi:drug/metabolite transporter (DMT)-like permease